MKFLVILFTIVAVVTCKPGGHHGHQGGDGGQVFHVQVQGGGSQAAAPPPPPPPPVSIQKNCKT